MLINLYDRIMVVNVHKEPKKEDEIIVITAKQQTVNPNIKTKVIFV